MGFSVHPSSSCGPFQSFSEDAPKEVVEDSNAYNFFLFEPAWVGLVIVALGVCIYYVRTMGVARKRLAAILRRRIEAEGMERALIAKLMVSGGQGRGSFRSIRREKID